MVNGILISMKSLLSASLLLIIMGFIFGVLLMEFVSVELHDMEKNPHMYENKYENVEEAKLLLRNDWGSVVVSVYTLYKAISGGLDWGDAAEPLTRISPFFGLLFCMYVAIAVFCVLNIITGVFVENTKSMLAKDESELIRETVNKRKEFVNQVKAVWCEINPGDEESLDVNSLRARVKDMKIQALFSRLGLDLENEDADGLFQLLDFDGSGSLDLDEFANGIQMLHGNARSLDMTKLRHAVASIEARLDYMIDELNQSEERQRQMFQQQQQKWPPPTEPALRLSSDEAVELLRLQALLPGALDWGYAAVAEPDGDSAGGGGLPRPRHMLIEEA